MKKYFLTVVLAITCAMNASAQFEKGKLYFGGTLPMAALSYSDAKDFSIGFEFNGGIFIEDDWLLIGSTGLDYSHKRWNDVFVGAKLRYYIEQNGLFLGAGARFVHEYKSFNDLQLTPEIGYCYFISRHITIEPSLFYNISLSNFKNKSEVGLKIGVGIYLEDK